MDGVVYYNGVRGSRKNLSLAMLLLLVGSAILRFFRLKYRRDTCEATHSYIYLLYPKLFLLSTYSMWYSMLKFGTFLYLFSIFN
jgi:hypothetical protein